MRHAGLGLELAGAVAGLGFAGYWADRHFGTSPWGTLGGVVLGLVGGLYNLIKESLAAVREARQDDALAQRDAERSEE